MADEKKTPLFEQHKELGATIVPFAGWSMPVQYTNVIDEHLTTRNSVGLFDISHMGEFMVSGKGSLKFLQSVVTNDIAALKIKQACYNCLCYENGSVIDDLFVYRMGEEEFFIVVNAGTIQKDLDWLNSQKPGSVTIRNMSDELAKLDLQGPKAQATLQKLTQYNLSDIKRFRAEYIDIENIQLKVLVSRTGYTGEDGFEIYCKPENAANIWIDLLDAGKEFNIKPCGLGARDTLRVEACYSLYGHELNDTITPIEAGLKFIVKFNKDFIGKTILQKQDEEGTEKKLICFTMNEKAVPREHYKIQKDEKEIGEVSSGTFSPVMKKGIGMGFIASEQGELGTEIDILIRGKVYKATITKRPFYTFAGGK